MENSNLKSSLPENRAIVYVRVSTKQQEEKGSIPYQIKTAKEYIANYNKSISESIIDPTEGASKKIFLDENMIFEEVRPASTVSNKKLDEDLIDTVKDRPKLQEILSLAERRAFGHLIVQSRDRLCRNFEQFVSLKHIFKKNNITVHYCRLGENLDFEDAKINRFVDNILASVAALEADIISIRVKSGSRQCIENGNWAGGRPPLGYLIETHKVPGKKRSVAKLKPSFYERNQVLKVYSLYNMGYSYKEIAEKINLELGEDLWTKSKVQAILKNQTYTGCIAWDRRGGRRKPGSHIGPHIHSKLNEDISFISKEYWESIEKLRIYKKNVKDPKYFSTPYLLKNKLVCGKCNDKLITKNYGKNNSGVNICVYKCRKLNDKKSELILNKNEIESIVFSRIKEELLKLNIDTLWTRYSVELDKIKTESEELQNDLKLKIGKIEERRNNVQFMINDLRNSLSSENNEDSEKNEDSKKDEDSKTKNMIKSALIDKLIYQDTLLLKVKQRYETDSLTDKKKFNTNYIANKSDYEAFLKRYIMGIDTLNERSKRILVDLIIDRIIVEKDSEGTSIDIVFNPSEVIKHTISKHTNIS